MSRASKITFGLSCVFTVTSVVGVYFYKQISAENRRSGLYERMNKINETNLKSSSSSSLSSSSGDSFVDQQQQEQAKRELEERKLFNRLDHEKQIRIHEEYIKEQTPLKLKNQ